MFLTKGRPEDRLELQLWNYGRTAAGQIYRGCQARVQSSLAVRLSIGIKWSDAKLHIPDLILRIA